MPVAADGTKHHSFSRAKFHDDMAADKKAEGMKPAAKPMAAKGSAGEEEPAGGEAENMESMPDTETPIEEHVEQHGPADEMHHKVGADGMHHVMSHHGKMKHKSRHDTHEEAHAHIGKAMGMGGGADEKMPMGANEPEAAGAPSGGIPGLE